MQGRPVILSDLLSEGGFKLPDAGLLSLDRHTAGGRQTSAVSETGHRHVPHCWATVTSGIPPQQPVFNGSICHGHVGIDNNSEPPTLPTQPPAGPTDSVALPVQGHQHKRLVYCYLPQTPTPIPRPAPSLLLMMS